MKKLAIFLVIQIVFCLNIAYATTYYVDATGGSDANNGTSQTSAWKSINKVNAANLQPGDIVLFKRAEIFRGNLVAQSGSSSAYIQYGAYGTGPKPRFYGSVNRSGTGNWSSVGTNLWRTYDVETADGSVVDAGSIIFNNEQSVGIKVSSPGQANSQGEFYSNVGDGTVTMYSVGNPGSVYSVIEIALKKNLISQFFKGYIMYTDLDLRYTGAHGIGGTEDHHTITRSVDFSYIGGSYLTGTTRYGNGVEFYNGGNNHIVEQCTFNQIYDVAMTAQGNETGYEVYNLYFRNNIVTNCEQSFEFWVRGSGSSAHDIYFLNNTCSNAGMGWSHLQRPDPNGTHLLFWGSNTTFYDIHIRNNIFSNALNYGIFEASTSWSNLNAANISINNNDWHLLDTDDMVGIMTGWTTGPTTTNYSYSYYRTNTGHDANSITSDPLLNPNGSIAASSPCINAGVASSFVQDDFVGTSRPQAGTYDIGAYEYINSGNLALNKTLTASSIEATGYETYKAADGNFNTRWSSEYTDAEWIYVDLGATYSVNRVKITWEAAYASAYQIQISPDAVNWTTMKTITGNTDLVNDHTTGIAGTGRYIRMLGTTRATVYGYSIFELEVYGVTNQAPTADAGSDKNITLPTNSVVINGSGTDSDGTITSYAWSTVSGPNTPSLSGAATADLTASGLVAGTYVFRLTVTDNGGLPDTDDVNVVVNGAPSSNLALNKTVMVSSTQPEQTVSYDGFKAVDGNLTTRWSSEFSDPQWIYVDLGVSYAVNRVKITWEDAYATDYQVQISSNATNWTNLKSISGNTTLVNDHTTGIAGTGRYVRIYGTARALEWGYSIFELEVYGVTNQAPTADAGADKNITLPTNSVVINGSGNDSDGTIASYAWTTISGPNTPSLSGASTANLTASGLVSGTYVFRLTVTDNSGAPGTDDVNVVVYSASGSNLALNKPVTVSSTQPEQTVSYDGFKAVDGNLTTRWSSEFSDPQWIYVDLGLSYAVNRVKITWEAAYATAYQIQISTNASSWTTMKSVTGNSTLVNDHTTGISGTGRYIRIYGTVRALEWGYSIFELEVYGTSPSGRMATPLKTTKGDTQDPDAFDPEAASEQPVAFYPNPAKDILIIRTEKGSGISLMDLTGRIVRTIVQSESEDELDVSGLANGFYIMTVRTKDALRILKVIKE